MWFTVAGRYQRGEKLAEGGSGTLYRAIDSETQRELALKCFHMHRAFDEALLPSLREAQTLAHALGQGVLVPLLDIGTDEDGTPYATMPLLKGETLAARLTRPLHERESQAIASGLAHAVVALRGAGFTHGDLSEENVFVLHEGGIVLLDHESVGRVGTPRPLRHTDGMPDLAPGMREESDDAQALLSLKDTLTRRASPEHVITYRYMIGISLVFALAALLLVLVLR